MNALTINPVTKELQSIDIEMKANSVYSFFNSILIDELSTLNQHTIYTNANALSQEETPFFIGEQLLIGNALIVGLNGMEEVDVIVTREELTEFISYDINTFYREALGLLAQSDINLYRTFAVQQEDEELQLNAEWVLYTFNLADQATQAYFMSELKKALDAKKDITAYLQKMAQLAINAAQ